MKIYQRLSYGIIAGFMAIILLAAPGLGQTNRRRPTAEHLFFKCKVVINPSTCETIANAIIETVGGKIMSVGRANEVSIPADAKVMDFGGKYVIPGLVLGSIEVGKLADFVVLNANPLENLSNVRQVYRVVKGGIVYDPEQLLKRLTGLVN